MSDPALEQSIAQLAAVMAHLDKESESLNARISDFEKTLTGLNPGIAVWCPNPIRFVQAPRNPHQPQHGYGSQVGFAKVDDEWRLWVRRGMFTREADNTPWTAENFPNGDWKVVPLTDATREERAAALKEFRPLVELLTAEAEQRLEMIRRANKQGTR